MLAGTEHVGSRSGQADADRHPAAQPFGEGDDVGGDAVGLEGVEERGWPDPGLDRVEDDQEVVLGAPGADAFEVLLAGRHDPRLALNRLQQDRDGALVGGLLDGAEVVVVDVGKALGHGQEGLLVLRLAGGRDRRQGAAVEALVGADDLESAVALLLAPLPGDLDRALVGLGAAVAVEGPAGEAELVEALGKLDLGPAVIEVAGVDRVGRLPAHRLDQVGVVVAQQVDGDAGDEVKVLVALGVVEVPAIAADQLHRLAGEGMHQVGVLGLGQRLQAHSDGVRHPGTIMVPIPSAVSSSSSNAWGTRPSMMWAFSTPARARTAALTLGIMPPVMVPSSILSLTSWARISLISWSDLSLMPSTSVSMISFRAPSATASSAATVSALTL